MQNSLSPRSKTLSDKSLNEVNLKSIIETALDQADQSFSNLEALCAFASLGGFEVPSEAQLALKVGRGIVKIGKTRKFKFSDAVIDGIGLAVPSVRLAGIKQFPAANRIARLSQLAIKRIRGNKTTLANNVRNAGTVYSSLVPFATNNKSFKAAEAGLSVRRSVVLKSFLDKLDTMSKSHATHKSKSLQKNVNHIDNLGLKLTRGKREKENNFEERIMNHVRGKLIRGKRESDTNFEERLKQYSKKFQKKY